MASTASLRALGLAAALSAACGAPDGAARPRDLPQPAAKTAAGGATSRAPIDTVLLLRADASRALGDSAAPVLMLIVSDFQCPYCRAWHEETYPTLLRDYIQTGRVRAIYFHLPLPSHPQAYPAAEAAMCAGIQGRFWPMQDALFHAQGAWANQPRASAVFDSLARTIGVEMAAFQRCVTTHATRPLIESDHANAIRMGIESTPTFVFVNQGGDRQATGIAGAQPLARFRQVIDSVLTAGR
jgi:protein-disulfide isomerase